MKWHSAAATHPGLVRGVNEDRHSVDDERGIFLVVDGLGGHAAGDCAAQTAVQAIQECMRGCERIGSGEIREAITRANNEIYRLAQENAEWRGMACVLTLASIEEGRVTVGHVGDSRLYLIWNGSMRKVTSDHSPVGEREDQGELTGEEAMQHPRRNEVFRDVGSRSRDVGDSGFIEIREFPFRPDAALLLCSDGLSDLVTVDEMNRIIERYSGDAEPVVQELVDAANGAGGSDNITAIFVAGPEFVGVDSARMMAARKLHSTTRPRLRGRRRPFAASRLAFLMYGILLASAGWIWLPRTRDRVPVRTVVGPEDPRGIVRGLAAARPGDTIEVLPGEYAGGIELREGVNLVSQQPGQAVLFASAQGGFGVAAHGIKSGRLAGFRITGTPSRPLRTGILLIDSNVEIADNEITGASAAGVRIGGESKPVLWANYIHGDSGYGVLIEQEAAPRLAGNRISGNGLVAGQEKPGIKILPPAKPVMENNVIKENGSSQVGNVPAAFEEELRSKNLIDEAASAHR